MPEHAEKENHATEVKSFLHSLFDGQEGFVYTPVAKKESDYWQQYFFRWPQNKDQILTHILSSSVDHDVYVAPSLFKAPSDKEQAWKGSHYAWAEFDGNAPETLPEGVPEPTIKIQSSESGHEHWYWRMDEFHKDATVLSGLNKQLAYTLDADKSGWDASQVLRPPGSLHQESKRRVRLLTATGEKHTFSSFTGLVTAPEPVIVNTTITELPDVKEVVAKYKWDADAFDLFNKPTQAQGSRSSAMTRLGFHCVEMGMSNEECYVVLYNADERWGKFKNRPPADRAKRLLGIVNHCRGKKELDTELRLSEHETFVSLGDFLLSDIKVKWLYEDFLLEQGLGLISASPGVGKSTLSFRLGFSTALGHDFLLWRNLAREGKKVAFVSLEMGPMECKKFIGDMLPSFSEEEQAILRENFFLLPLGYGIPLASKQAQQMIIDEIDKHGIEFVIVDSLKAATTLDEKKLDDFFQWVNETVREERKCAVWIIHHNRKPPNEGNRKPKGLEDLYGDTFISAHPSTVISLWKRSSTEIEVMPFKIRLAETLSSFVLTRKPHLDFAVSGLVSMHDEPEESSASEPSANNAKGLFG